MVLFLFHKLKNIWHKEFSRSFANTFQAWERWVRFWQDVWKCSGKKWPNVCKQTIWVHFVSWMLWIFPPVLCPSQFKLHSKVRVWEDFIFSYDCIVSYLYIFFFFIVLNNILTCFILCYLDLFASVVIIFMIFKKHFTIVYEMCCINTFA